MSIESPTSDVVFGAISATFASRVHLVSRAMHANSAGSASSAGYVESAPEAKTFETVGSVVSAGSAAWAEYAFTAGKIPASCSGGGTSYANDPVPWARTAELFANTAGAAGSAEFVINGSWVESGATHYCSADYAETAGTVSSAGAAGTAGEIPRYSNGVALSVGYAASTVSVGSCASAASVLYVSASYRIGGQTIRPVVPSAAIAGHVSSAMHANSVGYIKSSAQSGGTGIRPVVPYASRAGRATKCGSAPWCSKAASIDSSYAASAGSAAVAGPECIDPVVSAISSTTLDTAWPQTVSGAVTFSDGIVVPETTAASCIVPLSQVSAVISAALEEYASAHGL